VYSSVVTSTSKVLEMVIDTVTGTVMVVSLEFQGAFSLSAPGG
jgi:hypothetical protein